RDPQHDRRDFVWYWLSRLCRPQDRDSALGREFTFEGREGIVTPIAYSPDRTIFASGGGNGYVQLWQADGKKLVASLQAHTGLIAAVEFSPDSKLLVTLGADAEDHTVKLWDLTSRPISLKQLFPGSNRIRPRVLFTPDGKTLVAGDKDNNI